MTQTDQPRSSRAVKVLLMCAVDFTAWHFLRPLAKALLDAGYDVTIACSAGKYVAQLEAEGLKVVINPIARSMNPVPHLAELVRTYRLLRRSRFDVVHVHTPIAALVGRVAAWAAGVPVKIYTAHGFYFHEGMPPGKRRFHVMLEKLGARFGDFIMTVSGEDEKTAIALGICRPDRIETIYNGVDVERFAPHHFTAQAREELRRRLGIAAEAQVIGFVGRLVREKGIIELVQALGQLAPRFSKLRLLIVGDVLESDYDAGKEEFIAQARQLGVLERIAFAGMVDDTRPYLAAMDIFCLPSYREGMPVSLLEAMAMGLACVATNIRGCREEIVDGVSGRLVAPRDARALAEAFASLLENQQAARAMGEAARRRVLDKFDEKLVLAHELAIYRRLLEQKGITAGTRA
jgi:glycosyltransferase involved in cell wall biosynthesis